MQRPMLLIVLTKTTEWNILMVYYYPDPQLYWALKPRKSEQKPYFHKLEF